MAGGPLDVRFINRWACVPTSERYKVVFFSVSGKSFSSSIDKFTSSAECSPKSGFAVPCLQ